MAFLSYDSWSHSFLAILDRQNNEERKVIKNQKKGRPGNDPMQLLSCGIGHQLFQNLVIFGAPEGSFFTPIPIW